MTKTAGMILQEIEKVVERVSETELELLAKEIAGAARVFGAGAGRSGLMMKAFVMRLMHLGLEAYVVGETSTPSIQPADLFIIASGSGETSSMSVFSSKAAANGVKTALITTQPQSSLARMADLTVVIPASAQAADPSASLSIQFGGSLFEQSLLLIFDSLVYLLMQQKGITHEQMKRMHANLE